MTIRNSVGKGGKNDPADVEIIRAHLVRHRQWLNADLRNTVLTEAVLGDAVAQFQKGACALARQDGRVDPGGFTMRRLAMTIIPRPRHKAFASQCWLTGASLTDADYTAAATALGCEKEAIQAVAIVETRRQPFDDMGRPTILFERHKFREFTNSAYSATHPDLSNSRGGYGRHSEQYARLHRAATLNEEAALKSASWGAFQIMGFNFKSAGYASVAAFVDAMIGSQSRQLAAFVAHVGSESGMKNAIINRNWAAFARRYNGPAYAENDYDGKMKAEYDRLISAKAANRTS
ncbi:MAG: N-acetylmuramidase family protein [Paracoccus sp. (in: a-proteobacteria)]|nr:N-acetylmuramidase family protein [Paracoccus sp. (in: a-proteobacteria)]